MRTVLDRLRACTRRRQVDSGRHAVLGLAKRPDVHHESSNGPPLIRDQSEANMCLVVIHEYLNRSRQSLTSFDAQGGLWPRTVNSTSRSRLDVP